MTMPHGKCALFCGILALASLVGCSAKDPGLAAAIANPASEHCIKQGGEFEIVRDVSGDKGICHLPDGTAIEEWALLRRSQPQR